MGLSAESTKLLKEWIQEEFHQPPNDIRRQKEVSSQHLQTTQQWDSLSCMWKWFFFFPLRWNQARTTQSPSHYLLLPLATSFSKLDCLASPVVSWKRVTSSQNSLQSRKNGTTFILRYHILQSKLRVSFLAASTINFPTLSKQQERGQQREPSLQKSTHPSQSWVHFIGVSSGGDYLLPDPQNILCSVLSLLFYISSTVTIPSKVLSHFSDRGMSGHSWEKWSSCLWLGFLLECEIGLTFLKGQVVS